MTLTDSSGLEILARVLLTFPFWYTGLTRVFRFGDGAAEMEHFNLRPGWAFNLATLLVQLIFPAMIIADYYMWVASAGLAVFLALTVLLVHHFWKLEGEQKIGSTHTAIEHVGMVGGLLAVVLLAAR